MTTTVGHNHTTTVALLIHGDRKRWHMRTVYYYSACSSNLEKRCTWNAYRE
jgi:acetylornithine/succinyldiaminopimelate/putrescine aminotransferase